MYKRNCAKSRKKLGGVYLLGNSRRAVGSDACIRPRGCTSLPDCTGGYGIRPYGHVGEHSICSRGSMKASTPTGKSVAKSHPSVTCGDSSPQGEPYGTRHPKAPPEGSSRAAGEGWPAGSVFSPAAKTKTAPRGWRGAVRIIQLRISPGSPRSRW